MINKNEFYKRVRKLRKILSITGRVSYSNLSVVENLLSFKRDSTQKYRKLNLDDLYNAYLSESVLDTIFLRKYIKNWVYSPALAVLIAIKVCDQKGIRK